MPPGAAETIAGGLWVFVFEFRAWPGGLIGFLRLERRRRTSFMAGPGVVRGPGRQRSSAAVAQPAERVLGKDEVMGSNPISSTISRLR